MLTCTSILFAQCFKFDTYVCWAGEDGYGTWEDAVLRESPMRVVLFDFPSIESVLMCVQAASHGAVSYTY